MIQIPGTGKFQYQDTPFVALVKAQSGIECYYRIIDHLNAKENQSLRDEVQTLRLAASQANQNAFITANQEAQTAELIRRLGRDCPVPAYVVPNPNCCYNANVTFGNGCGCGGF